MIGFKALSVGSEKPVFFQRIIALTADLQGHFDFGKSTPDDHFKRRIFILIPVSQQDILEQKPAVQNMFIFNAVVRKTDVRCFDGFLYIFFERLSNRRWPY